jgi:ADP-heptose:LPS heptosyltransferase
LKISRILIYRLGSLGDTIVALPCFHLVERAFPTAHRALLTNAPVNAKAPPMGEVLGHSGLVDSWFGYPVATRKLTELSRVIRAIREWKPELLVYLTAPRRGWAIYRDLLFFRLCGVRRILGAPVSAALRENQLLPQLGYLEYEAERLARCIHELGDACLEDSASWDLRFNSTERAKAEEIAALSEFRPRGFLACSIGTKVEVKDWGEVRWARLLKKLAVEFAGLGLVLAGSGEETVASDRVAREWKGHVVNLCGKLSPRETAAVFRYAKGFIGHDSGPMHLAAAAGVRCTAIFSARNIPRVWFPYGEQHRVIYHRTPCAGCGLERCLSFGKRCIESITVDEVFEAAAAQIAEAVSHGLLSTERGR